MKAGDIVTVKNWGAAYSTNYLWFDKFKGDLEYRWMICYAFGDDANYKKYYSKLHPDNPADTSRYTVLFVGDNKALITESYSYALTGRKVAVTNSVYLIDEEALEVVRSSEDSIEPEPVSNDANDAIAEFAKEFVDWLFN